MVSLRSFVFQRSVDFEMIVQMSKRTWLTDAKHPYVFVMVNRESNQHTFSSEQVNKMMFFFL